MAKLSESDIELLKEMKEIDLEIKRLEAHAKGTWTQFGMEFEKKKNN